MNFLELFVKQTKFKKLPKSSPVWIQAGFASNGHWLFDINWLSSLKRTRSSGLISLLNRINREQVETVKAKLAGRELHSKPIEKVVNDFTLELSANGFASHDNAWQALDLSTLELKDGYFKGHRDGKQTCAVTFKQERSPILDVEYSPALFFDRSAQVMIKDEYSPIIILTSHGSIAAMIGPLNFKTFVSINK